MNAPQDFEARPTCPRCRRPLAVCYCSALRTVETKTRVVILQHPREQDMPIGTARIAQLCLPQSTLHVGVRWEDSAELRRATTDPDRPAILLYPGPGARDILRDPPKGPVTLVVVDGTWSQAKTLVRDNPSLAALPRFSFNPPELTHYRIRREPRPECVSTLEALMHVLGVLEGEPERFRELLVPMTAMIDAHLAQRGGRSRPRQVRPAVKPLHAVGLPSLLTARTTDLLCVVADVNAWPYDTPEHRLGRELLRWTAFRPATGECFDAFAAPSHPMAPGTPDHTGIPLEVLLAGRDRAAVVAAFARFVRPTDVVCAWGSYGPSLFRSSGGSLPSAEVDLRAVARSWSRRGGDARGQGGTLEEFATRLGVDEAARRILSATPMPGRAGRRLALMAAMLEAWLQPPPT